MAKRFRTDRARGADAAGSLLLALELGGLKADEDTEAATEYLLRLDRNQGYWVAYNNRPPSEGSAFSPTYLALRGLKRFGSKAQHKRIAVRLEQALRWLRATPARDNEDRVYRLLALDLAGAPRADVQAAAQDLARTQRKDGGWAQTDQLSSDAYATGSALAALHWAGRMAVRDWAFQRGLAFLLATQKPDGSWYVKTRSKPLQTYFDAGFPYGKDQFISCAATGWAATALALACPVPDRTERLATPRAD
jgi:squalene cyclase